MTGKLLTELVGAFFLMLTVGLTVLGGVSAAPLAIGSVLMVMVYMGGPVSGGHYNPAVTLAVWLRGRSSAREAGSYMAAQLFGAMLAAGATRFLTGEVFVPAPGGAATPGQILLIEVLFSFALCLVVLHVATCRRTDGNSYFGLAIGFTVMVGAYAGGAISGGAFNPAVGLGPALVAALGGGSLSTTALYYLVGPLTGAVLAVALFRVQVPDEFLPPVAEPVSVPFPAGLKEEPAAAAADPR